MELTEKLKKRLREKGFVYQEDGREYIDSQKTQLPCWYMGATDFTKNQINRIYKMLS